MAKKSISSLLDELGSPTEEPKRYAVGGKSKPKMKDKCMDCGHTECDCAHNKGIEIKISLLLPENLQPPSNRKMMEHGQEDDEEEYA